LRETKIETKIQQIETAERLINVKGKQKANESQVGGNNTNMPNKSRTRITNSFMPTIEVN